MRDVHPAAPPPGQAAAGAMAVVCACGAATVTPAHVVQPADPVPAPHYTLGTGGGPSSARYDAYHDKPGGREIDSAPDGVVTPGTQSVFTARPRWPGNYGGPISPF